jgi:hypothetical protein
MRPEQKIILSCRQTGERAERLQEWLDQSRLMLKSQNRALRTEVQGIHSELSDVMEAVDLPPTAGVLGSWGSHRAELIGALVSEVKGGGSEDETRTSLGRDRLLTLMPRDSDGGQAASLRFVSAARTETPFRFPIQIALLGQLDLVRIMACAYAVHVPRRQQRIPAPEVVAERLATTAEQLGTQSFSGMARRDIDSIRDTLNAAAPESDALRSLEAAGYWDTLGGLIPHLPDAARRRAFAMLWGADPALTELFDRLSDAIELLGFSGEAFAGLDALTGRDAVTGWMTRHEDSVIATSTLFKCCRAPERTVRISSRHGRATDIERFIVTALAREVRLPVDAAALPLTETADLLVLPAPAPVMIWPPVDRFSRLVPPSGTQDLKAQEALEIFAAAKAVYLADQAVRRHTLTSLLVVAESADNPSRPEIDASVSCLVANWVELNQGETAHARERRRTGLNILVAEVDRHALPTESVFGTPEIAQPLRATIEAVFDGNGEWATEWTPNRPFRGVFTWQPPRGPNRSTREAVDAAAAESADILRFDRHRPGEASAGKSAVGKSAELSAPSDLTALLEAVTQATTAAIHAQHLSARLVDLRRNLSARFLRLHISNDPTGIVEWRRQVCHVARNRLDRASSFGAFGRLQRALMFSEVEALAVIARLKVEDPRTSSAGVVDLRTVEPQRIVEACLETWIVAMRQITRAAPLMRALRVPGTVVAHVIDELVLGAVRIGLQQKLTEAVRRIQLSAARSIDCEQAVAALIARGVNAYVETLDPGARGSRPVSVRDTRFGMSPAGGAALAAPSRAASTVAAIWAETFSDLVEANILGASLLGGAGHLNRELGEVLNAMSAQSYEGSL